MNEVEIKFEREERDGIVPVGTYLSDAASRLGIDLAGEQFDEENFYVVKIIKGGELLSAPTKEEIEKFSDAELKNGKRLANHARIGKSGELIVMTTEKKAEEKPREEERREQYRKEFEELPLEKKIASLVELEAIALGETFTFILNSPYKIVGKIMDVMAEFGLKLEDDAKKQSRPEEHQPADPSVSEDNNGNQNAAPSVSEESVDDKAAEPSIGEEGAGNKDAAPSVGEDNQNQEGEPSVSEDKKTGRGKKADSPSV